MVSWSPAPEHVGVRRDEVQVWCASLDQLSSRVHDFENLLSAEEQQRAHQFHFQRDRERFILARSVLRSILSRYLNRTSDEISFRYNRFGKPALSGESGEGALQFNLSHSNGTALYGFTSGRQIGLDVEYVRGEVAVLEIAQRFFSRQEVDQLLKLPAKAQRAAFFHCWTRKEAYIKALGEGLSIPLDEFTVSVGPGEPAALLCASQAQEVLRWRLQDLTWNEQYAAAIAVEGSRWKLRCWKWEPSQEELRV